MDLDDSIIYGGPARRRSSFSKRSPTLYSDEQQEQSMLPSSRAPLCHAYTDSLPGYVSLLVFVLVSKAQCWGTGGLSLFSRGRNPHSHPLFSQLPPPPPPPKKQPKTANL